MYHEGFYFDHFTIAALNQILELKFGVLRRTVNLNLIKFRPPEVGKKGEVTLFPKFLWPEFN